MTETGKYKTSGAFRAALEARLKIKAASMNRPYPTVRKLVAFDRLLARIFFDRDGSFALKGGYSLELRLGRSRTTQDVDLILQDEKLLDSSESNQGEAIKALLQEKLAKDLADFFSFRLGKVAALEAATLGGYRIQVTSFVGGINFEEFHLDIAIAETDAGSLDELEGDYWLDFADIPQARPLAISQELQFAEKLHAYTFPWEGRDNTREKDLIDMVALLNRGLNPQKTQERVRAVFAARATHDLPAELNKPPTSWGKVFERLAQELNYSGTTGDAYDTLDAFYREHLAGRDAY